MRVTLALIMAPYLLCLFVGLFFRTESVAEKMLTNWFTFLLYKFLKVRFFCMDVQ